MARVRTIGREPLVYVGPNRLSGSDLHLLSYQTFQYIPESVENDPDLKQLFVPLSGLHAARAEMKVPGSRLYNIAQRVVAAGTARAAGGEVK